MTRLSFLRLMASWALPDDELFRKVGKDANIRTEAEAKARESVREEEPEGDGPPVG